MIRSTGSRTMVAIGESPNPARSIAANGRWPITTSIVDRAGPRRPLMPVESPDALEQEINRCHIADQDVEVDVERLLQDLRAHHDQTPRPVGVRSVAEFADEISFAGQPLGRQEATVDQDQFLVGDAATEGVEHFLGSAHRVAHHARTPALDQKRGQPVGDEAGIIADAFQGHLRGAGVGRHAEVMRAAVIERDPRVGVTGVGRRGVRVACPARVGRDEALPLSGGRVADITMTGTRQAASQARRRWRYSRI